MIIQDSLIGNIIVRTGRRCYRNDMITYVKSHETIKGQEGNAGFCIVTIALDYGKLLFKYRCKSTLDMIIKL